MFNGVLKQSGDTCELGTHELLPKKCRPFEIAQAVLFFEEMWLSMRL